ISAAFDTICHRILLDRLSTEFGISSNALDWLRSYVSDRKQFVKISGHPSSLIDCTSGVPQGSVLGPILFAAYVSPVGNMISSYGVQYHSYADDTQIFLSMQLSESDTCLSLLSECTDAVKQWYLCNHL